MVQRALIREHSMRRMNSATQVPDRMTSFSHTTKHVKENDLFSEKKAHKTPHHEPAKIQHTTSKRPSLTAYVAHYPSCLYSEDLVALAEECGIEMNIYDVQQNGMPVWQLPGVPTIETNGKEVFCGDAAFNYILALAKSKKKDRPEAANETVASLRTVQGYGNHDDVQLPKANRMLGGKAPSRNNEPSVEQVNEEEDETKTAREDERAVKAPAALTQSKDGTGGIGIALKEAFAEGERMANIANSYNETSSLSLQQIMDQKMSARS